MSGQRAIAIATSFQRGQCNRICQDTPGYAGVIRLRCGRPGHMYVMAKFYTRGDSALEFY